MVLTEYRLVPFKLIRVDTGEPLTHKDILEMAKEKGFFDNEFKSYQIMLKENGTPIVFGYNPLTNFSLNKDDYKLEWVY